MNKMFRRLVALIAVLCMMLPMVLVPAAAENEAEEEIELTDLQEDEELLNEEEDEIGEEPEKDEEENPPEEDIPEGSFDPDDDLDEEKPPEEDDSVAEWEQPEDMPGVPLYLQTDYDDVPYGSGTVATSGCTMACIAMVTTYLTGNEVKPDELAKRFRNADGSHIQRMEAIATIYDLNYTKTFYPYNVVRALEQGKVVILMVASPSDFTKTQHLMVLTEILPNGRIMVNDPMGKNYRKEELDDGFTYGFTQEQLFTGFSGAWIFEFYTPPQIGPTQYPGLTLTDAERDLLAKLVWREARGESFEGQQAVAEVVLNRVISERFPTDNVISTIYAPDQFRTAKFMKETTADELQYKAVDRALSGPNILPTDVYYFSRVARNKNVWGQIGEHVFCKSGE